MVLYGIFALFLGWFLHLGKLDVLFHELMNTQEYEYYMIFFVTGMLTYFIQLIKKK